jgi:hypothetical protein
MNHLEFAAAESAALSTSPWERWAARVEGILGHSLDGNQDEDGYSMDEAYEVWESGESPQAFAYCIYTRPGYVNPNA